MCQIVNAADLSLLMAMGDLQQPLVNAINALMEATESYVGFGNDSYLPPAFAKAREVLAQVAELDRLGVRHV